jgi:hypothetical protein
VASWQCDEPMPFSDLSVDLLPLILCQLSESRQLANACLVSKTFYTFAAPALYERPCLWNTSQLAKLFRTLAQNRRLALHVRFLGRFHSSISCIICKLMI